MEQTALFLADSTIPAGYRLGPQLTQLTPTSEINEHLLFSQCHNLGLRRTGKGDSRGQSESVNVLFLKATVQLFKNGLIKQHLLFT